MRVGVTFVGGFSPEGEETSKADEKIREDWQRTHDQTDIVGTAHSLHNDGHYRGLVLYNKAGD